MVAVVDAVLVPQGSTLRPLCACVRGMDHSREREREGERASEQDRERESVCVRVCERGRGSVGESARARLREVEMGDASPPMRTGVTDRPYVSSGFPRWREVVVFDKLINQSSPRLFWQGAVLHVGTEDPPH